MKKLITLMMLFTSMLAFTACGGDDDKDEPSTGLAGTSWSASYVDELFVIEFESNSKVSGFRADANGNIKGDVYYGTYSVNGNKISLKNFSIVNFYEFHFTDGSVSGNNMVLNYWWEMGKPGDKKRFDDTMTFHKR